VTDVTAEYFDQWYSDIARSATRQQLFTDQLGLPPEVGPSNTVPLAGLQEIAAALALPPDGVLVDLACGRGGPGMWIAREVGARLIGVDFSAEAIDQATARRELFGLTDAASFQVGSLEHTGVPDGVADAAVCVDAFQFAADGVAAAREVRRVLRPGGRVVLTSWEPADRADESVGARIRAVDLAGWLAAAGFTDIVSEERQEWHDVALRMWHAAMTMDIGDDPAMISTHAEGVRSIANHDRLRRVMATATAP
jgi:SAM-dependent methyltransferase